MNRERPPPGPFTLLVLEHFQNDPVLSLERAFPPTHALVRGVQAVEGMPGLAVVEFELIDQPPAPSSVVYGGFFGESAFERAHHEGDREAAWFCFDATLPLDINVTRLRAHVRDSIALVGARGGAPACRDELELGAGSADRKAAVRKRRRAPPPPEPPPPPPLARPEPSTPASTPPPLPMRAKGSDRGHSVPGRSVEPTRPVAGRSVEPTRPALGSMPPELDPPTETHTPLPRRLAPSSIPPPPPEPPPPEPLPRRTSYRPPAPPDSLPTAIHRRRSNQPPPEPPPPPPFKRD